MLPPIQNLHAFVAVAQSGQFRIAAQQIGVTESAISHQISRLEAQMGAKLLERDRNGVRLTDVGHSFYQQVAAGLREIEVGVQLVKNRKKKIVTVSVPQTLASLWLAPNMARFYEANPSIELRVSATDRLCDLRGEGIDIAIRRGDQDWPGCEAEPFCTEDIFPVASKELVTQIEAEGLDKTLETVPIILNEAHTDEWDRWCEATGTPLPNSAKLLRLGSYDQVQAAVTNGLGIGMARTPLCLEALTDGRLHRIGHESCTTQTYQLVWPTAYRMHPPQRAFAEWLREARPDARSGSIVAQSPQPRE